MKNVDKYFQILFPIWTKNFLVKSGFFWEKKNQIYMELSPIVQNYEQ